MVKQDDDTDMNNDETMRQGTADDPSMPREESDTDLAEFDEDA